MTTGQQEQNTKPFGTLPESTCHDLHEGTFVLTSLRAWVWQHRWTMPGAMQRLGLIVVCVLFHSEQVSPSERRGALSAGEPGLGKTGEPAAKLAKGAGPEAEPACAAQAGVQPPRMLRRVADIPALHVDSTSLRGTGASRPTAGSKRPESSERQAARSGRRCTVTAARGICRAAAPVVHTVESPRGRPAAAGAAQRRPARSTCSESAGAQDGAVTARRSTRLAADAADTADSPGAAPCSEPQGMRAPVLCDDSGRKATYPEHSTARRSARLARGASDTAESPVTTSRGVRAGAAAEGAAAEATDWCLPVQRLASRAVATGIKERERAGQLETGIVPAKRKCV